MKAIILAGGKGSRFLPLTETIPKALIPINETTLIERVLASLPDSVTSVIIVIDYLGDNIRRHIGDTWSDKTIHYAPQTTTHKGTWSALMAAQHLIDQDECFCVMNCDDIFDKTELTHIIEQRRLGIGATTTEMPAKYHGLAQDCNGYWQGLQKHTTTEREVLVRDTFANGFFVLTSEVFSFEPVALIDGELGLPQTLLAYKDTYPLYIHTMTIWMPCNTPNDRDLLCNKLADLR